VDAERRAVEGDQLGAVRRQLVEGSCVGDGLLLDLLGGRIEEAHGVHLASIPLRCAAEDELVLVVDAQGLELARGYRQLECPRLEAVQVDLDLRLRILFSFTLFFLVVPIPLLPGHLV
jgi:hypothetical protein